MNKKRVLALKLLDKVIRTIIVSSDFEEEILVWNIENAVCLEKNIRSRTKCNGIHLLGKNDCMITNIDMILDNKLVITGDSK